MNNNYKLITIAENVNTSESTEDIEEYEISFSGSNSMTIYSNFDPNDANYNVSVLFNKVQ